MRIARLLDTDVAGVAFLDDVDIDTLDELTDQITAALFDPGSDRLGGLRVAANLLPVPVAATIGERAMGPVLCALLVGAVDDARLVAIAKRLPPPFLAEVAVHIDPRRVPAVIAALPSDTVGATAGHLAEAGEYATMGLFVDHLGDDALAAAVDELDGEALLRTAAMARAPERIDRIATELDDDRVTEILLAAHRQQAWLEALSLLDALSDEQRTRLADLAIQAEEPVVEDLVTFAVEHDLLDAVLPLVGAVSPPNLASLASRLRELDPVTLDRVIAAATVNGLHRDLVVLLSLLTEDEHDQVVDTTLRRTAKQRAWADLLPLVALLPEATQARLAAQAEALSDRDLSAFVRTVEGAELWEPALQLVAQWADATQDRLLTPMARLSKRSRTALGAQVDLLELRERIGALADLLVPPDQDQR